MIMLRILLQEIKYQWKFTIFFSLDAILIFDLIDKFNIDGPLGLQTLIPIRFVLAANIFIQIYLIFSKEKRDAMYALMPVTPFKIAIMRISLFLFYFALFLTGDILIRLILFLPVFRIASFWASIIVYGCMIAYISIWSDILTSSKDKKWAGMYLILIPLIIIFLLVVLFNYTHYLDFVTGRRLIIFLSIMPVLLNIVAIFTYKNRKSFVRLMRRKVTAQVN